MSVRVCVVSNMNPEIELDLYEMTTAAQTGLLRVTESIKQNQEWWHGYKGTLEDKISKSIVVLWQKLVFVNISAYHLSSTLM